MPTGSARRGEAGYTLAVLVGILTVLGILLAAAVPHWVARVQHAKEAELVARCLQYAEAIRVFQRRQGRLPNTLQELVEVEPRSIRQLWKNPFSPGEVLGWAVLMEVGGQVVPLDPVTGAPIVAPPAAEGEAERLNSARDDPSVTMGSPAAKVSVRPWRATARPVAGSVLARGTPCVR